MRKKGLLWVQAFLIVFFCLLSSENAITEKTNTADFTNLEEEVFQEEKKAEPLKITLNSLTKHGFINKDVIAFTRKEEYLLVKYK